jgi:transposase
MRKKGSAVELERTRMIAANMFDQGMTPAQVAVVLDANVQTARRWRRALYSAGGREALRLSRHPGRPPLLNDDQRRTLAGLLLRTPAECGFDRYLWTTQLIADLIAREFGVGYHHDHVGVILGAMGFSHQKPARRARERDEAAIAAWRSDAWPALLKKAPRPAG